MRAKKKAAKKPARPTRMELFEEKVIKQADPNGCHLWDARLDKDGYGQFRDGARVRQAHVWIWEQKRGPITEVDGDGRPLELDHKCRNRPCVNVDHLELVTHAVNMERQQEAQERLKGGSSERSEQRRKKAAIEATKAHRSKFTRPFEAALWYMALGQTAKAAEQAAELMAHGAGLTPDEIAELAELAQSDELADARTGANAFDARLSSIYLRLLMFGGIKSYDLLQPGQVAFSVEKMQRVQQGFGGTLAQFKRVELDLTEILGAVAGGGAVLDLKRLHAEVYGARHG